MHRALGCTDQNIIGLAAVDGLQFQFVGLRIGVVQVTPECRSAAAHEHGLTGQWPQVHTR